jgi:prolyl oligopeptidase
MNSVGIFPRFPRLRFSAFERVAEAFKAPPAAAAGAPAPEAFPRSPTRRQMFAGVGACALLGFHDAPAFGAGNAITNSVAEDDPFLWLEQLESSDARAFVDRHNAQTLAAIPDARFEEDRTWLVATMNAPDRIPGITRHGRYLYNFWRDAVHPRGVFRRTTLASYRTADPVWDVVFDVDALAETEKKPWVWRGATVLAPEGRLALVSLSLGGADATVIREFDLMAKDFVEAGFALPESKGGASWLDADTLLVSAPLGGDSFRTASGYPRTVRRWRRGTAFADAPVIFEGERTDTVVAGAHIHSRTHPRTVLSRRIDAFNGLLFLADASGAPRQVLVPPDAKVLLRDRWVIVKPESDWTLPQQTFVAGSLLAADLDSFMNGSREFAVLFTPTPTRILTTFSMVGRTIALNMLDNVRSRIELVRWTEDGWQHEPRSDFSDTATLSIAPLQENGGDEAFIVAAHNNLVAATLAMVRFGKPAEVLKQAPERFSAAGLAITQHYATSIDGATIPYFQVARANLDLNGENPVLLRGYGGFGLSVLPGYDASIGKLWLERGGVYVIANIRGGGEFGPAWHKAGIRAGKKLAHDDFAAVARDLIARGVTRPQRLACEGGSNGGLLVGNMLTRYPELFGAIVCASPLLDMKRYTKLTAGPSWIAEYGNPDVPQDWSFLEEISAYHHVARDRRYPPIMLTTSRRDDRVHPGHARKMAAKLAAAGHEVYFREAADGGHAGGSAATETAFAVALVMAFLRKTIAPEMAENG